MAELPTKVRLDRGATFIRAITSALQQGSADQDFIDKMGKVLSRATGYHVASLILLLKAELDSLIAAYGGEAD